MIKFGIIGCGLMGERRAESLKEFSNTKLIAVADIDLSKAEKLAEEFNCEAFTDYSKIIINKDIDAIIVCVPNNLIARISKEAVEAGKHVLFEKPGGRSAQEIKEVMDKIDSQTVKAGFNHRFFPHIQKARSLIAEGKIGEILFIKGTYGQKGRIGFEKEWRANKERSGGGELIDQGVHMIDLCRVFMGDLRYKAGVSRKLFWNIEVDDNDFIILENKNRIAFLHMSSSLWENAFEITIEGTHGMIFIKGIRSWYGAPTLRLLTRNEEESKKVGVYQFDEEITEFPDEDNSWKEEMKNFIEGINGGKIDGGIEDAYAALKIVDKVYAENQ